MLRGQRSTKALLLGGALALVFAGVAWATFQPNVSYDPPVLKMEDAAAHNSVEDVTVRRAGSDFTIRNEVSPATTSAPECAFVTGGVSCPREGIEKIVILLGALDDSADIDLDKSADKVRQILKGQDGEDEIVGAEGVQKLAGGASNDTLIGGPGPDILAGGSGTDICDGGAGHDEFISCEQAPTR